MKKTIVSLLFCLSLMSSAQAQCTTYVEMITGLEGCIYPYVISTQQLLLPCTAPAGFDQLVAGDFALIDFIPSGCISFCMSGYGVEITCFTQVYVGMGETKFENRVRLYPNPAVDNITIESPQNASIEMINLQGQLVKTFILPEGKSTVDVSDLSGGVYFIKFSTEEGRMVRKFVKE